MLSRSAPVCFCRIPHCALGAGLVLDEPRDELGPLDARLDFDQPALRDRNGGPPRYERVSSRTPPVRELLAAHRVSAAAHADDRLALRARIAAASREMAFRSTTSVERDRTSLTRRRTVDDECG